MNNVVYDFDNLPEEHRGKKVSLYEWIVPQGDYVEEGKPLFVALIGSGVGSRGKVTLERASASGVVEHLIKTDGIISLNAPVARLHDKGSFISENLMEDEVFYSHFNRFNYSDELFFGNWNYKIESWHVDSREKVQKGQLVLTLKFKHVPLILEIDKAEERCFNHYSEREGFLFKEYLIERYGLSQGKKLYRIQDTPYKVDTVKKQKWKAIKKEGYSNVPKVVYDPFLKSKVITWDYVGSSLWRNHGIKSFSNDRKSILIFSFNYLESCDYLVFHFSSKHYMLREGDKISFLFSNDNSIDFELNSDSYLFKSTGDIKIFENKIQITGEEILLFQNEDLKNWKITLNKSNQIILGLEVGNDTYLHKEELVKETRIFANQYSELVRKENPAYQPLLERQINQKGSALNDSECYVYLMVDTSNNFHKIGISNSPDYRERTLQSEKPTIELLAAKKFVNRDIASSFEKALHSTYESKRLRGEWFELEENEISDLITTLND
jgi:hypothetical protein